MTSRLGGLPAHLPAPPAPMDRADWLATHARRLALCEAASLDPALLPACLAAWDLPAAAVRALVSPMQAPSSPDIDALCAWAHAPEQALGPAGEDEAPRAEAEWDRLASARPLDRAWSADERRVAALHLLTRLGEELALRERDLPAKTTWLADPRDARAAAAWRGLLRPEPALEAGPELQALYGGRVRAAFHGVSTVLGLPEELGRQHGEAALEQLDLVVIGAHRELATRVLETSGEPIARLEAALSPAGRAAVAACVAGRDTWARAATLLGRPEQGFSEGLGEGADLVVLLRLVATLERGQARPHSLGLPGWGVVGANRSRVRGRLRAVAGERPEALREAILGLDAPYARTCAAVSRFAWAWAWREARRGFGFDLARMLPAPCTLPPPRQAPLSPLGPDEEQVVLAFLLVVLGRGCWSDLERWLSGDPGRDLSRTFYRCLEQLPDRVADPRPAGQRHRSYQRLVALLEDDGLEELLPRLRGLATLVAGVQGGPGLRERIASTLDAHWRGTGLPMPRHHLSSFQEACAAALAWGTPAARG